MAKLRILVAVSLLAALGGCAVYPAGYYRPGPPVYAAPAPPPYYARPYGYGYGHYGYGPGWRRW